MALEPTKEQIKRLGELTSDWELGDASAADIWAYVRDLVLEEAVKAVLDAAEDAGYDINDLVETAQAKIRALKSKP